MAAHPWFAKTNWSELALKKTKPPFRPKKTPLTPGTDGAEAERISMDRGGPMAALDAQFEHAFDDVF